jgi:hypothetical protein
MFGKLEETENLDPKNTSKALYWRVMVKGPNGIETLLFTESELEKVRHRVMRNPEDTVMVPTLWDKFRSWI